MKRVGCLYRVSTKKQADDNDIPVQRMACIKFINKKDDWKFVKEYVELGISGYKISEKKRDILQDIKKDALRKEFDILLVFMFDRIGRREDETPLVVRWLIDQGIEVWSVNEGQRTIKDRNDKLLNYITYWQAEGESEKTSLRATERRIQLTKEGIYMGNYPPYGYQMIESDEVSKMGKKRRILKVYPKESYIIITIFNLFLNENYGTDKIAIYLNNHKIKRRKPGVKWDSNIILEILKNPIYKGYVSFMKRSRRKDFNIRNNKTKWIIADKPNEDIVIISEERWNLANKILDERSRHGERMVRLLSGLTRCGYCGDHITPKGKNKYVYMLCKGKQKIGFCEYNANYRIDKLENIIEQEIKHYLFTLKNVDLKNIIRNNNSKINRRKDNLKRIERELLYYENRIQELKKDIVMSLLSQNDDIKQKVNEEFNKNNMLLEQIKIKKHKLENEIMDFNKNIEEIKSFIPNWLDEFEDAAFECKREIVIKLIDKIFLYNNKIEICIKYPISKFIVKEEQIYE